MKPSPVQVVTYRMMDKPREDEHVEITPTEARQGLKGSDVLAILAVSTFLAAVGLTTFFLTTALSG